MIGVLKSASSQEPRPAESWQRCRWLRDRGVGPGNHVLLNELSPATQIDGKWAWPNCTSIPAKRGASDGT